MELRRIIGMCLMAGVVYIVYAEVTKQPAAVPRPDDGPAQGSPAVVAIAPFVPDASDFRVSDPVAPTPVLTPAQVATDARREERETSKWIYQSDKDDMRGTTNRWATLVSDNTADVGAYRIQPESLRLDIRDMPKKYGLDVIFSITKGQIHCDYDGCRIPVKFDNGPIITYTADRAEAGHDSIFIREKQGFIRRAKQAKKMIVEVPIWRKGPQQFTFSPQGLAWESKTKKK